MLFLGKLYVFIKHLFFSVGIRWRNWSRRVPGGWLRWGRLLRWWKVSSINDVRKFFDPPTALCVQMDVMWTFETTTKCNNLNYVWSHFYQILVVLTYHRRLWANIFDTDISRSINTKNKSKYSLLFRYLRHRYLLIGGYGTSNLLKPNKNNFKHYLYCCI